MPAYCTKFGTHGIEIQDSSNNPIGYFGCLSLGAWIDACSTILAFEGCTTAQRDSAVERLVYELTSNAFGEANSGFLIEKTGTPGAFTHTFQAPFSKDDLHQSTFSLEQCLSA